MAFALTATLNTDAIRQIDLAWTDQAGRYVTVYRSTAPITIDPTGQEAGWTPDFSSAEKFENLTGNSKVDAGLADGTYYYYATDGESVVASVPVSVVIDQDSDGYADEIQDDYVPTSIEKVSMADAYRNALNNGGSTKFNPIVLPFDTSVSGAKNKVAVVVILGGADELTEAALGTTLSGKCRSFAILQSGEIYGSNKIGAGYEAQFSGSTQVKYVKK